MPGLVRPAPTTRAGDQRWIGSRHALDSAQTGTIKVSDFTKATHYPDGFILSGQPVNVADPANIKPYTGAAGQVLGFLKDNHQVTVNVQGDVPTDIQVAYLWHGRIKTDFLPGGNFVLGTGSAAGFVFEGAVA